MNAQPAYFPASDCRCRLISSALWNALAPTSQLLTSVDDEVAFLHGEHMRQTPVAAAVRSVRPKAMRLDAVGDQPFAKIAKPLEVSQAFWRRHTTSAVIARRCRDPVITHTPAPARRCVRGALSQPKAWTSARPPSSAASARPACTRNKKDGQNCPATGLNHAMDVGGGPLDGAAYRRWVARVGCSVGKILLGLNLLGVAHLALSKFG